MAERNTRTLVDDVAACFREHQLLRAALVELMRVAKPWLEPVGSYGNPAMAQARAALEGRESA